MKNKGFTLIELLAVIVILAIIALIAVPIVLNIIDNSKKSANQRSVELYVDAVEKAKARYMVIHPEEDNITFNDIKDLIEYSGETVECATIGFDTDGNVYATNCSINNTIVLNDEGEALEIGNVPLTLAKKILADNTVYPDNVRSPYVDFDDGIHFDEKVEITKCSVSDTDIYAENKAECEEEHDYCIDSYYMGGYYVETPRVDEISSCTSPVQKVKGVYEVTYNGKGLYSTNTNTEDNKITYYFRGETNNYVNFAGFTWKIIRINEDGSIRIIKVEKIGESQFNESNNNKKYIGYMYGTDEDPYANINSSTIKTYLDAWYQNNLLNYSNYIADSGFCGDRTIVSEEEGKFWYGTLSGFACSPNDLYTTNSSLKGNKALAYPIGLITDIEYLHLLSNDGNNNLYNMSPRSYSTSFPGLISSYASMKSNYEESVTGSKDVYPVINLKSDTLYTSGTGTQVDPYIVG